MFINNNQADRLAAALAAARLRRVVMATIEMTPRPGASTATLDAVVAGIYDAPIILAEVGVSRTPERQSAWLTDAVTALGQFPAVQAIVYFDAVNAANNHRPTQPDWRLRPADFVRFAQDVNSWNQNQLRRSAKLMGASIPR